MPSASFAGSNLALLLLGGYRKLVDAAVVELEARGFKDVRAQEHYAMVAIQSGADTASELGRRLSVTKQAAAKTIGVLLERGYITRDADPTDARRKRLTLTPLGTDLLRQGREIFNQLRTRFQRQIGREELLALEAHLASLVGETPVRRDAPGWVAQTI
jgi:DNA-binding MarR family transcriptional regulator